MCSTASSVSISCCVSAGKSGVIPASVMFGLHGCIRGNSRTRNKGKHGYPPFLKEHNFLWFSPILQQSAKAGGRRFEVAARVGLFLVALNNIKHLSSHVTLYAK